MPSEIVLTIHIGLGGCPGLSVHFQITHNANPIGMRGFRRQVVVGFPEGDDMTFADFVQVVRSLGLLDEFDELDHPADLQAAMGVGALAGLLVGQGLDVLTRTTSRRP